MGFFDSGLRVTLTVALIAFAVHIYSELRMLGGHDPNFVQRVERTALDAKFTSRGANPPERWGVAVAAIDEKSINALGRFPWSRDVHARLVDKLTEMDASVIAFDVTFADPTPAPGAEAVKAVRTTAATSGLYDASAKLSDGIAQLRQAAAVTTDAQLLLRSAARMSTATVAIGRFRDALTGEAALAGPDEVFAKSIEESGRVVLGILAYSKAEANALEAAPLATSLARVSSSTIAEYVEMRDGSAWVAADSRVHFENGIYRRYFGVQAPAAALARATPYFGTINAAPDGDGVIRSMPIVAGLDGTAFVVPSLSLAAVAVAKRPMPIEIVAQPGALLPDWIQIDDLIVATEIEARATIDWYGSLEGSGLPVLSIADILDGQVRKEDVEGRIIFVAATALGTYDQRVTPLSRAVPGVFIHATLAQNILDGRQLSRPMAVVFIELLIMLAIGLIGGLVLTRMNAVGQLVAGVVLVATWLAVDRYVFFASGIIVSAVLPTAQIFATVLAVSLWRFLVEERERRKTRQAFQRYLAPAVMDQVLSNPEEYLKLGGRRYEATVLFSDIRGFTTISERLSPEELGLLLNHYMTPMTNLVFETGGTLDKYIGDAVMAFWGAPIQQADHAVRGCRTALRMMEKVAELNGGFERDGLPTIAIGIGLSTGPMTIGNMGSDDFFAYTALGDKVNLGARLEGQTKDYGVDIIISEECYEEVKGEMSCRELGAIRVKGKNEPVRIYQLMAEGPLSDNDANARAAFNDGLVAFRGRRWGDAVRHFTAARETFGEDKTSDDYIRLCREYQAKPPPPDWDGVRTATSK